MSDSDRTVIARNPLLLLRYVEQRGLDRDELMRAVGLSDRSLADPDSRIPLATTRKLWRAVIRQSDDEYLGIHTGQTIKVREMGLVGYAMYHGNDLYGALTSLSRYGHIVSEAVQFMLSASGDGVILRCHAHPFMVALRHPIEATLSLVITVARELTGTALKPVRIRLPSPQPETTTPYTSLFGTAVTFDWSEAEMEFSGQQMNLPTLAPDSTLSGYLTELAESKITSLGSRSSNLVDRVRRAIWRSFPNEKPDLQTIASRMGMSARTLQRRLRDAGTSYSATLENFRREMAMELRTNRGFAAAEVAFMLGYSESSAYQRAARRWREMSDI